MSECRCGKENCPGPDKCVCGISCSCTVTTIRPDDVMSELAETTTGIEPFFVAQYRRNSSVVLDDRCAEDVHRGSSSHPVEG